MQAEGKSGRVNWVMFGLWRSLVARLLGVQEVVGSNPASPTKVFNQMREIRRLPPNPL